MSYVKILFSKEYAQIYRIIMLKL